MPPMRLSHGHYAQASTEYLVIIAVVLVLALVILGLVGGFPSFSYNAQAGDSVRYWASSASPIAIIDFKQVNSSLSLRVENKAPVAVSITAMSLSAAATYPISGLPISLPPGGAATLNLTTESCTGYQSISYAVNITYSTDQVSSLSQSGAKPLYVSCSD